MGRPDRSNEIGVMVTNGVVTLTGWVDSYSKKWPLSGQRIGHQQACRVRRIRVS